MTLPYLKKKYMIKKDENKDKKLKINKQQFFIFQTFEQNKMAFSST